MVKEAQGPVTLPGELLSCGSRELVFEACSPILLRKEQEGPGGGPVLLRKEQEARALFASICTISCFPDTAFGL